MAATAPNKTLSVMVLAADTAEELMMPNPISIRENLTVQEATALLLDHGFSAAPVIDEAGRPVGVVSRSDVLAHDREKGEYVAPQSEYYEADFSDAQGRAKAREGFQVVDVDRTRVRDIMTPIVFCVGPKDPAKKVVSEMLSLNVHRLFVVDRSGVLVGVISALDVLRRLQ